MAYPNDGEEQTCPECGGPLTALVEVEAPLEANGSLGQLQSETAEVVGVACDSETCAWLGDSR